MALVCRAAKIIVAMEMTRKRYRKISLIYIITYDARISHVVT